jgi:16S rRNA (cytosine967-C5)-methyltransferase
VQPANTTKFHPLLVRAVAQALYAIFKENRYADKVIEQALKQNPKAGSRDRAFIAETTYEVVRYYRLYCEILGRTPENEAGYWEIIGIHGTRRSTNLTAPPKSYSVPIA